MEKISRLQLYEYQLAPSASFGNTIHDTSEPSTEGRFGVTSSDDSNDSSSIGECGHDGYHGNLSSGYHKRGALVEGSTGEVCASKLSERTREIEERSCCTTPAGSQERGDRSHDGAYSDKQRRIIGLLAQEVRQVLPSAVMETVRSDCG